MLKECYIDPPTRSIADLIHYRKRHLITRINVPKKHRGKGIASMLLKQIITDCPIGESLIIHPSPSDGLNYTELVAWYKRHGFVQQSDGELVYVKQRD